eukprot:m.30705 g.30705  ORF g.30705 m.30705 type:complete len:345 (-) comp41322_c0_seq1:1623-2657(-)
MEALFGIKKKAEESGPAPTKPWVEKYRPKTVDEVVFQEEVVAVLRRSLEGHDMPHLLFYGPPGTGKTSTILAVAKQLFGAELFRERVLELNASDDRGIQAVREKVKNFAQQTVRATVAGHPCPPYKIIVLDEADSMTSAAQSALRRTMEAYAKVTRFCLICNYVSRIIEPLASRCAKFRFKPLSSETVFVRLAAIREAEGVNIDDKSLSRLITLANGDLRQAITFLQSAHRLYGAIEPADIEEIACVIPDALVNEVLTQCRRSSFDKLQEAIKELIDCGYSGLQFVSQVHDKLLLEDNELVDSQKAQIAERLAIIEKRLIDGADEYLQLLDLASSIMAIATAAP